LQTEAGYEREHGKEKDDTGGNAAKYIETGEEIHKPETELGRLWKEPLKWREEFMPVLKPA